MEERTHLPFLTVALRRPITCLNTLKCLKLFWSLKRGPFLRSLKKTDRQQKQTDRHTDSLANKRTKTENKTKN